MTQTLAEQIAALPAPERDLLQRYGFDEALILRLAARLVDGHAADEANRVTGRVTAPGETDVIDAPQPGSPSYRECVEAGEAALRAGECAMVVLAGGMATRMGGVVKALVEPLPGLSFLELRLREQASLGLRLGREFPLWLMTSHATESDTRRALGERFQSATIATFPQYLSVRLRPEGALYLDHHGRPSVHAPGHGDLPDALRASGLLQRFLERGGKWLTVANLDNLGANLDPALIGWHILNSRTLTCEVVDKTAGDRGGIPVRLEGRPVVLEEFRLPRSFDPSTVSVFSTNTFHFDAAVLHNLDMDFTFFAVFKEADGQRVVQFERLLGEVTSVLPTRFLRVSRTGDDSRFLPVKNQDELAQRAPEIERVARARGWL